MSGDWLVIPKFGSSTVAPSVVAAAEAHDIPRYLHRMERVVSIMVATVITATSISFGKDSLRR